jgi:hypothetical protein
MDPRIDIEKFNISGSNAGAATVSSDLSLRKSFIP